MGGSKDTNGRAQAREGQEGATPNPVTINGLGPTFCPRDSDI